MSYAKKRLAEIEAEWEGVRAPGDCLDEQMAAVDARWGVYVIQAGRFVKVGITSNIRKRLQGLQHANPMIKDVYYFTGKTRGAALVETDSHKALERYWVRGEWFRCRPETAVKVVKRLVSKRMASGRPSANW